MALNIFRRILGTNIITKSVTPVGNPGDVFALDADRVAVFTAGAGTNPAGSTGELQYNAGGLLGAITNQDAGKVLTSNGALLPPTFQDIPDPSPGGNDKDIQYNNNGALGGITPGASGTVLTSDGTTASFQTPATQTTPPGGSDKQVQVNDANAFNGISNGTSGHVLTSNGASAFPSFQAPAAGNPAGTTGQVQVNNTGAFGAIAEGIAGQVLTSAGAGLAPTFENATAGNPGGSDKQLQVNNAAAFGGISNGTSGQILISAGAGAFPAFGAFPIGGSDKQIQSNNAGALGGISNGTSGHVLTSAGAGSFPSFQAPASQVGGSDKQIQYNNAGVFGGIAIGTNGQVLTSNGTVASFQNPVAGTPAGSDKQIQVNDAGVFGALSNATAGYILTSNGTGSFPSFQPSPAVSGTTPVWYNVDDFGAVGDGNYSTGTGTDDTTAIQAAYTAAGVSGSLACVVFTAGKTYRVTSSINVAGGTHTRAFGGRDFANQETPATVMKSNGTTGVFLVTSSNGNIFETRFENIDIIGAQNAAAKPTWGVRFASSGGGAAKLDTGTVFKDVWFASINGNAIEVDTNGATNLVIDGGRFDAIYGGYAIYADLNGASFGFNCTITGQVNYTGGNLALGQGKGFIYLSGESGTGVFGILNIQSPHTEINGALTSVFSGSNPYDSRGIIRLGINPSATNLQYIININGWHNSDPGNISSYSCIQITAPSGTTTQASNLVGINIIGSTGIQQKSSDGNASGEVRIVGGMVPSIRQFPFTGPRVNHFTWGFGLDNNNEGLRSFYSGRDGSYRFDGFGYLPKLASDLQSPPVGGTGAKAVVTNSTSTTRRAVVAGGGSNVVEVMYDGSNWIIM